jgi:hypothetical protein
MKPNLLERSVAVLLGLAAGYLLWLVGITALTVVIPTKYMIIAAAVLLGVILILSLTLSQRFRKSERPSIALGIASAPVLPVIASIYSLIVFLS